MTTDNASSNKKMIAMMVKKLKRDNKNFTAKRHIPCFANILNLVVQSAIKSFDILMQDAVVKTLLPDQ